MRVWLLAGGQIVSVEEHVVTLGVQRVPNAFGNQAMFGSVAQENVHAAPCADNERKNTAADSSKVNYAPEITGCDSNTPACIARSS